MRGLVLLIFNTNFRNQTSGEDMEHIRFDQKTWSTGWEPLPVNFPRYPLIRTKQLQRGSPVDALRISASGNVEKPLIRWSKG